MYNVNGYRKLYMEKPSLLRKLFVDPTKLQLNIYKLLSQLVR